MAFKVIDGQLTNLHHKNWPKRSYTLHPPEGIDVHVSRRFRNLPCQTEQLEVRQHIKLHLKESPPPMPTEAEMRAAIEAVVKELGSKGLKDMGRTMAALKERHTGSMDFGKASAILKEALK